jgi:hypothetical protein
MKYWFLLFTHVLISGCGFHLVLKEPVVGEVEICDASKNCSPKVLNYSEKIILKVKVKYAPFGTKITSHWYYLKNGKPELIRERITDLEGTKDVLHGVKVPKFGYWKDGNYEVIIKVNNKVLRKINFKVKIKKKPVKTNEDDEPLIVEKVKTDKNSKKTDDSSKIDKNSKKTEDSSKTDDLKNINTDDLLDQDI